MATIDEVAATEVASACPEDTTAATEDAMTEAWSAGMGTPKAVPQAISCIIVVVTTGVTVACLLMKLAPKNDLALNCGINLLYSAISSAGLCDRDRRRRRRIQKSA